MVDRPAAKLNGLVDAHVMAVARVQHTVRKGRTRANREHVALMAIARIVDHVEGWALVVPACNHGTAGQALSLVLPENVGEQLGGSCHGDLLLVSQLVHSAQACEVPLPERAVCRTSGHGSKEAIVDLNDLFHRLGADVTSHGCSRVDGNDDPALKHEAERGCTLLEVHEPRALVRLLHVDAELPGVVHWSHFERLWFAGCEVIVTQAQVVLVEPALSETGRVLQERQVEPCCHLA
mmetsp:Transcript_22780/g.36646  ORF Transcript_22780/g.36646 Transcript_22780/m.36646 type:complete len:236 (+) Transcript_22780:204-911(+)